MFSDDHRSTRLDFANALAQRRFQLADPDSLLTHGYRDYIIPNVVSGHAIRPHERRFSARTATSCRRRAYSADGTARLAARSSAGAAYRNSVLASALSISLRARTVYQKGNFRH